MIDTELREIDAQVHREVMGVSEEDIELAKLCHDGSISACCEMNERGIEPIPYYSTDIAAAWQVVEKLVADGRVFIVKGDGLRTGDFAKKWTTLCGNQMRTDATSAPLAICLAALKAVRGDMGQSAG